VREPLKQPNLAIEASRGASVYLSHIHAVKAELADYSYDDTRKLNLSGVRPGLEKNVISLHSDYSVIGRAEELRLFTDQSCDAWKSAVLITTPPQRMAVNEEALLSPTAFATEQDPDRPNVYNCLFLEEETRPEATNYYDR
jgi:hypothetical protein